MADSESNLARAERQAALVVRLAMAGRRREAEEAQQQLATLEQSLRLAQEHLRRLRETARLKR